MLELKNISKYFGKSRALNGLNMKVEKGELFGFIGPNGAGKTTTMKIISGILIPDSGDLYFAGKEVRNNKNMLKGRIGYMPDFFGVYDNLTVLEYMEFFASLYNIDKKPAAKRIDELLELVSLSNRKAELVDELSRGMKQKLCLARTMVHQPEILVLDEPASGMEPSARIDLKTILKHLSENGATIIISSHILSELSELCDNIGIIIRGEMVIQGRKEEVIMKQKSMQPLIIRITEGVDTAVKILKSHPLTSKIAKEAGEHVNAVDYVNAGEYDNAGGHVNAGKHINTGKYINTEKYINTDKYINTGKYVNTGFNNIAGAASISLQFLGEEEEEIELLSRLIYAGVKVLAFKREESDLESIFLELTKNY